MSRRTDVLHEVIDNSLPVFDEIDRSRFDDASMRYANSKTLKFVTDEFIRACRQDSRNIERFYKALEDLSTEEARTLLHCKDLMHGNDIQDINFDDNVYRKLLESYFRNNPRPLLTYNRIIEYKINNLLPEKYLDWFKDNLRHSLFLAYLMKNYVNRVYDGKNELINVVSNMLRYKTEQFISSWRKNLPEYKLYFNYYGDFQVVHVEAAKTEYFKNRLDLSRDAKWIDATNEEQIEWIYQYLRNEKHQQIILDNVFFPKNIEEKYELILASLDVLSNVENAEIGTEKNKGFSERGYTLYSMKKAWDGQKHYSQKKQVENGSIKIYKKNQDKLKALIKFSGFTANQVINNSIEQMYIQLIENAKNDDSDS
ncbi:hypothetical protein ACTXGZ_05905 [Psychrobacter celer]|uniref:hypothetical protein n=1 Tax=Psychrobacter celer TaxID=306572 RepID=UPI003FD21F64